MGIRSILLPFFIVLLLIALASCTVVNSILNPAEESLELTNGVCLVTDTKGLGDRSFNDTAWKGVTDAKEQFGVEADALQSQVDSDYEKNINRCVQSGSLLTVAVGYLIGDATAKAAAANPDHKFAIVDYSYDPGYANVLGLEFATDQAAFLAGYLAAGVTKTGKVGTFGGVNIPTVTIFMDGLTRGVQYYNDMHGTAVQVIGWDPVLRIGLFTETFDVVQKGVFMGELLMDEGVDIIMPVAGGVGQGTAIAAQEHGGVYLIGVDSDWTISSPEYASIILTSVIKRMDVAVLEAIQAVIDGSFEGGVYIGTLLNEGVGITSFNELDSLVSGELKAELDQVKTDIIDGKLQTGP